MKKFLAIIGLMLASVCGVRAQTGAVYTVSVVDPNNFQISAMKPLSFYTGSPNYLIAIPSGITSMSLTVSGVNNSDTLQMFGVCVADGSTSESGLFNGPQLFISWIKGSGGLAASGNVVNLSLQSSQSAPTQINVGVLGCGLAQLTFSSPTGTLTDQIRIQGQLNSYPIIPFGTGGPPMNIGMGVTVAGLPIPTPVAASGVPLLGVNTTDIDGFPNTNILFPQGSPSAGNDLLASVQHLFNGTAWDRGITCPNTTTFSVASTVTQVVPASGSTKVRICSVDFNPATATAGSVDLVYGTGVNCGTGTTTLTGAYTLPAAAIVDITPSTLGPQSPLTTPASQAVCVRTVTSTVNGFVVWEQH